MKESVPVIGESKCSIWSKSLQTGTCKGPNLGLLSSLWGTKHTRPRTPGPVLPAWLLGRLYLWVTSRKKPAFRKPPAGPELPHLAP